MRWVAATAKPHPATALKFHLDDTYSRWNSGVPELAPARAPPGGEQAVAATGNGGVVWGVMG
jgi:hypothetical protein